MLKTNKQTSKQTISTTVFQHNRSKMKLRNLHIFLHSQRVLKCPNIWKPLCIVALSFSDLAEMSPPIRSVPWSFVVLMTRLEEVARGFIIGGFECQVRQGIGKWSVGFLGFLPEGGRWFLVSVGGISPADWCKMGAAEVKARCGEFLLRVLAATWEWGNQGLGWLQGCEHGALGRGENETMSTRLGQVQALTSYGDGCDGWVRHGTQSSSLGTRRLVLLPELKKAGESSSPESGWWINTRTHWVWDPKRII